MWSLIGIDIGTTHVKATVLDLGGRDVAGARLITPWISTPTGGELDPTTLSLAAFDAVQRALACAPPCRVIGIGITSMAETGVLIDNNGNPVAPAIAWYDKRSRHEIVRLEADVGRTAFAVSTGLPVRGIGSVTMIASLRDRYSLKLEELRWLNVAEWIAFELTREPISEPSLASRTGLLDVRTLAWWKTGVEWLGLRVEHMPRITPAGTCVGVAAIGPSEVVGAAVTVAGWDHPCGAVGAGAVSVGDAFDSCGTAQALTRRVAEIPADGRVAELVERGLSIGWDVRMPWHVIVGGVPGGGAVAELSKRLRMDDERWKIVDSEAARDEDNDCTGDKAIQRDIREWRRVANDAEATTRQMLATIDEFAGPTTQVVIGGGGIRSEMVRAAKERCLPEAEYSRYTEPAARGAGLFAGVAAEVYEDTQHMPGMPGIARGRIVAAGEAPCSVPAPNSRRRRRI